MQERTPEITPFLRSCLPQRSLSAACWSSTVSLVVASLCVLSACSSCGGDSASEGEAPVGVEPPAPPPEPTLASTSFELDNGLNVELVSGPCGDTVGVAVLFEVGMDHDPAGRSGMAHLVERLLSAPARPERLVSVGRDHTLYSVAVPRDRLLAELDDVAARMARSTVTEADFSLARSGALAELGNRHGGDATLTALSYASESVVPTRGAGWLRGVAAEVEATVPADVEAFWQAGLSAGNTRLIVTGSFEPAAVRARIETAFGPLPAGSSPVAREPTESSVSGTLVFGDAPSAVAVAVRAPAPSDPLYPAFLVLAARLMAPGATGRAWEASYDPIERPEVLFLTGALLPGEVPDAAATRIRNESMALLTRALDTADVETTRGAFARFLGQGALDPAACESDPRALAVAGARRAQLGLDALDLAAALESVTDDQRAEAALGFAPTRTAAIVAGGTIR